MAILEFFYFVIDPATRAGSVILSLGFTTHIRRTHRSIGCHSGAIFGFIPGAAILPTRRVSPTATVGLRYPGTHCTAGVREGECALLRKCESAASRRVEVFDDGASLQQRYGGRLCWLSLFWKCRNAGGDMLRTLMNMTTSLLQTEKRK